MPRQLRKVVRGFYCGRHYTLDELLEAVWDSHLPIPPLSAVREQREAGSVKTDEASYRITVAGR